MAKFRVAFTGVRKLDGSNWLRDQVVSDKELAAEGLEVQRLLDLKAIVPEGATAEPEPPKPAAPPAKGNVSEFAGRK